MRNALVATLFLCLCAPAAYADNGAAQAAFEAGSFADAAQAGEAANDAAGYSLAARALIADCIVAPADASANMLDRAERDAQRALTLDPQSVDARLSLAVAYGVKGRRLSLTEAFRRGYAQKGKKLIEEAIVLAPNSARAQALLGGWHMEVLRRAGRGGALIMGAGFDRGVAAFERARARAPDDPAIALHYAIALLALDPHKHGARAGALLAAASNAQAKDALERAMREEARRLGALMATEGAMAAAEAANERNL
jgi:hypothetical protein